MNRTRSKSKSNSKSKPKNSTSVNNKTAKPDSKSRKISQGKAQNTKMKSNNSQTFRDITSPKTIEYSKS